MSKTLRGQLPTISPFTFGSMSLGQGNYDMAADVKVARAAMDSGVWFHSSDAYQQSYQVLRKAFDEDRAHVPKLIIKMDANVPAMTRAVIEGTCRALNVPRVDVAQMCVNTELPLIAEEFKAQGERWQTFCDLKDKGLVGSFVLEIWPNPASCKNGLDVLRNDLVDGYIFYYNLFERFVSNDLYDLMRAKRAETLALRTLAGAHGPPQPGRPDAKWDAIQALYKKSGCKSMLELAARFILNEPNVQTTICGTKNVKHLSDLLDATRAPVPLDPVVAAEIGKLHRAWAA